MPRKKETLKFLLQRNETSSVQSGVILTVRVRTFTQVTLNDDDDGGGGFIRAAGGDQYFGFIHIFHFLDPTGGLMFQLLLNRTS